MHKTPTFKIMGVGVIDANVIFFLYLLNHALASSPGPFPAFQCCTLKSACNIEKLGMGLGTRLSCKMLRYHRFKNYFEITPGNYTHSTVIMNGIRNLY